MLAEMGIIRTLIVRDETHRIAVSWYRGVRHAWKYRTKLMEYKWKSEKSERSLVENGSLLKSKEVQRKT